MVGPNCSRLRQPSTLRSAHVALSLGHTAPLNPPLRASPCAAFGLAFSPLRPPLGGTSRPLSSGGGAGVATLLNPTPSRERRSLQRHQVLSLHKPLRFAALLIPRSLDPFAVQHLLLA